AGGFDLSVANYRLSINPTPVGRNRNYSSQCIVTIRLQLRDDDRSPCPSHRTTLSHLQGGAYETHALGLGFGVCDFSFRAAAAADRPTLHNASDIPAGQGA